MERIELWSIDDQQPAAAASARRAEEVKNTETERLLEELLVRMPSLLLPGLTIVGRQLPTAGGPLDLLGVDQDGRLVLFELKRGTLTRDAIAQALDYASDLAERDAESLIRLIEEHSGQRGVDKFEDFPDWLRREYPDAPDLLESTPRIVLVGLGADDRARRIVEFLVGSGIDIQLLTFHAFRSEGRLFLAKTSQVSDAIEKRIVGTSGTKAGNMRALQQLANDRGVGELLNTVSDFIETSLHGAYRWPGKTAVTFSLSERTAEGRPSYRAYVSLLVDQKQNGRLVLSVNQRGIDASPEGIKAFLASVPAARRTESQWTPLELSIDEHVWSSVRDPLRELLAALLVGWKKRLEEQDSDDVRMVDDVPGAGTV